MPRDLILLDRGWGWAVVVAGMLNNFLCMGLVRSGGIVFISAVEAFNSTRAKAAWIPMITATTMFGTAPIGTAIARNYSFHLVIGLGGTLAVLGFIICYFATQIEGLMIGWGVVFGLGSSFVFFPSVAAVGYYLKKWRPLGTGLVLAGGGIGSFCLSPLLEHLIDIYNLNGAILIVCSLSMNFWVSAFLFKVAASCENNFKERLAKDCERAALTETSPIIGADGKTTDIQCNKPTFQQISHSDRNSKYSENSSPNSKPDDNLQTHTFPINEKTEDPKTRVNFQRNDPNSQTEVTVVAEKKKLKSLADGIKSLLLSFDPSILKSHKFIVNCISNALQTSIFLGTITLLPDYSEDEIGLTRIEGAYFVSVTAISDLCLRLFISWLMSKVTIPKEWASVVVSLVYAVTLIGLEYSRQYSLIMFWSVILGGCFAVGTQVYFEILVTCQSPEKYVMAVGFSEMVKAVSTVGIASVLGTVKDATGTYSLTFEIFAALMCLSMILWIIEIYSKKIKCLS